MKTKGSLSLHANPILPEPNKSYPHSRTNFNVMLPSTFRSRKCLLHSGQPYTTIQAFLIPPTSSSFDCLKSVIQNNLHQVTFVIRNVTTAIKMHIAQRRQAEDRMSFKRNRYYVIRGLFSRDELFNHCKANCELCCKYKKSLNLYKKKVCAFQSNDTVQLMQIKYDI